MKKVNAAELEPGQVIRVEYGDYGNWVDFTVDGTEEAPKGVRVRCHNGRIESVFVFEKDEAVEVKE